jgi:ribonuclease HI
VLVSTDSNYVKKGITEWIHKMERNGWKSSDGKSVANKSLWQRSLEMVQLHAQIE